MSIKAYLFILFAALILGLGLSQVLLTGYVKGQLDEELQQSSLSLSRQLVSVVVKSVGDAGPTDEEEATFDIDVNRQSDVEVAAMDEIGMDKIVTAAQVKHGVQLDKAIASLEQELSRQDAAGSQQRQLPSGIREELRRQYEQLRSEREHLRHAREAMGREYQQKVKQMLDNLQLDTRQWLDQGQVQFIENGKVPQIHRIDVSKDGAISVLTRFREWTLLLILASCTVGILLAYWLSHHVSRPLSELALGHKLLGEGKLGIQLEPRGVEELQQMLQGFNAMSAKLLDLSRKEQQLLGQQHLVELGEITRGIAHSLRNPLHTLGLLSDALAMAADGSERERLSTQIQQKIAVMDKHIQTLLTLGGGGASRRDWVPLAAVVQDIQLELSVSGLSPEVTVTGQALGLRVRGLESEVRSILHAVMVNGCEAQQSGEPVSLGVAMEQDECEIRVRISDMGTGLPQAIRAQLGQPHISSKPEGTGMGLYIAMRLLDSHYGGRMSFEDNPGGGTRVTVHFARQSEKDEQ
jgi:signal transduction histidine kinase